jgi:Protein of unknown function (DUF2612)
MSASIEDFDFSVEILSALIWRNNEAPNLEALLQQKQDWYEDNHTDFWNDWITNVFNLDTVNEFGLSVWAQILGLPLTLIVAPNVGPQFGFGPTEIITDAADAHGTWTQTGGAVITAAQTDPNGNTKAVQVSLAAGGTKKVAVVPTGSIPAGQVTMTFQAKLISGTQGTLASDVGGTTLGNWPALSSAWQTVSLSGTLSVAQTTINLISSTVSTAVVAIYNPQLSVGNQTSNGRQNFDNGNFGVSAAGVGLTLDQKRLLLKLQYFKLTTRCTVPEINARMKALLGQYGNVYVLDANNMSFITYVFGFMPNSALQFVLENFDVLPRPAAVGVKYIVSTRPSFGFGSSNQNFDNGTFWAEN